MPRRETKSDLATPAEAARALGALSPTDQRRLELIARARASGLASTDWRDLLQESIARTLEGSRRWPCDVPIVAFLAQTMRSIASELRQRAQECLSESVVSQEAAADDQLRVEAADQLRRIDLRFASDQHVRELMLGLQLGETARETQHRAQMTPAEYDAARKRFWRGIAELNGESR